MEQQPRPSPGRRLRDAWTASAIQVPGVFNPLVARLAERSGFQAVYLSGAALSASAGVPDVGLLTATEFADAARAITRATRSEERRVGKECRCRWSRYHKHEK